MAWDLSEDFERLPDGGCERVKYILFLNPSHLEGRTLTV
jgi:hypothetical protein